jgi:prepilin peptidase CpaA
MSLVWSLFAALMLGAAATDIASYRIPNLIVLLLVGLFAVVLTLLAPAGAWQGHLLAGGLGLLATIVIYSVGGMGAGDAKLIAAALLWCGTGGVMALLFWIAISGLGVAAVLIALRLAFSVPQIQHGIGLATVPRVLRRHEGVPYGVAIASGALIASNSFPHWLWTF